MIYWSLNKNFLRTLFIFFVVVILAACKPVIIRLKPGGEKILITYNKPPAECKLVGNIHSENDKSLRYKFLEKDQIDNIRNQALDLGGNVILITQQYIFIIDDHPSSLVGHETIGKAYYCNGNILSQIKPTKPEELK